MILQILLGILVVYSVYTIYKIFKSENIHLLLKVIILFSWFFWFFMPYVITPSNFSWFDRYLAYPDYVRYYLIDALYWIVALRFFLFLTKKKRKLIGFLRFDNEFQAGERFNKFMLIFSVTLSLFSVYKTLTSPMTYIEINSIENAGASNPLLEYFSVICIAYIYYTLFFRFKDVHLIFKVLIVLIILMDVVGKLTHGSRIVMILPILILLYFYLSSRKKKYAIVGISFVALSLALAPIISATRTSGNIRFSLSATQEILKAIKIELIVKSNSVYYGASYLDNGGWGAGGFNVTWNTLLSNIPMPKKPIPMSIDGTYMTVLPRLAGNIRAKKYDSIVNVGIAPSHHPIWTYGWIGYFIYVFFAGFLLWIINYWLRSEMAFPVLFSLMFLSFPICEILKPIDAVFRDFPRYFIFYIFFYLIGKLLFPDKKTTKNE